ncbi:MAG: hypothetical protein ABI629_01125 [bacterium]
MNAHKNLAAPRSVWWRLAAFVALTSVCVTPGIAQAAGAPLVVAVTTNKGCLETGQNPVFAVGEGIAVTFRIGSSVTGSARATLIDYTPDAHFAVFSFGQVATNQTFVFRAAIGGAAGVERLVLRAQATGFSTQQRACSFTVASSGTPVATRTPTVTRTPRAPTATRTAATPRTSTPTRTVGLTRTPTTARTPTATRTPGAALAADMRTNRGCREDGDVATFAAGESIAVAFEIDSSAAQANASITDSRPDGSQTLFSFGWVPTNVPLQFGGRVGPPSGAHVLRLRAAVGSDIARDTCTFLVNGTLPTAAPYSTRTATPTRTATATRPPATLTPTRTFTPAP